MTDDLRIRRILRDDDFVGAPSTLAEMIAEAGNAIDANMEPPIVLFEGEDGKFYVGTVEFVVSEANPELVKEELESLAEDNGGRGWYVTHIPDGAFVFGDFPERRDAEAWLPLYCAGNGPPDDPKDYAIQPSGVHDADDPVTEY